MTDAAEVQPIMFGFESAIGVAGRTGWGMLN